MDLLSDLYDDDRPYFMKTNEKGDKILQIPQQWANFDLPYFAFNYRPAFPFGQGRVANYSNVLSTGKMSLPVITTLTSATICSWTRSQPEVRDVSAMLREFLEFMCAHEGVWFVTGSELVDFCKQDEGAYVSLRETKVV